MSNLTVTDKATQVLRRLRDASTKSVCYDVETSGLDWRRNFIVVMFFHLARLIWIAIIFPFVIKVLILLDSLLSLDPQVA